MNTALTELSNTTSLVIPDTQPGCMTTLSDACSLSSQAPLLLAAIAASTFLSFLIVLPFFVKLQVDN